MSQREAYTINNANRIERKFLPTCKVLPINFLELNGYISKCLLRYLQYKKLRSSDVSTKTVGVRLII